MDKRKPTAGVGWMEFVMSEKEIAVIPKGSCVSIMGCRFTLLEDAQVEANQTNLDYILQDQKDFDNGIGRVSEPTA